MTVCKQQQINCRSATLLFFRQEISVYPTLCLKISSVYYWHHASNHKANIFYNLYQYNRGKSQAKSGRNSFENLKNLLPHTLLGTALLYLFNSDHKKYITPLNTKDKTHAIIFYKTTLQPENQPALIIGTMPVTTKLMNIIYINTGKLEAKSPKVEPFRKSQEPSSAHAAVPTCFNSDHQKYITSLNKKDPFHYIPLYSTKYPLKTNPRRANQTSYHYYDFEYQVTIMSTGHNLKGKLVTDVK